MKQLKREIIKFAKKLNITGLSALRSGNISARYKKGFLITPSGIKYEQRNEFVNEVRNSVIRLKSEWYAKNNQNDPNEIAHN